MNLVICTDFNDIFRLKPNRNSGVQGVGCEFVFMNKRWSGGLCNPLIHELTTGTYLLTGSLMAVRKSWACSAIGEKASRIMCPSSGLIHRGQEAWSGLRGSHENSWSIKIWETSSSCCRRWISSADKFSDPLESLVCLALVSLRVRALKLIVAPRGTREVSGGESEIASSSSLISKCSFRSASGLARLVGYEGSGEPSMNKNQAGFRR